MTDNESVVAAKVEIGRVRDIELESFSSGDLERFLSVVTDDVVFDPWIGPAVHGRDGTTQLFNAMLEHSTFTATYEVEELHILGDWAFDRGMWLEEIHRRSSGEEEAGSFGVLQVYRREPDGAWKLARSIWNRKTGGPDNYISLGEDGPRPITERGPKASADD